MPSDFVDDLNDGIALQYAIGDQSEGRADIKSAGVSIDETDAHGVRIARAMDVVVNNFYRDNAAVLAEWGNRETRRARAAKEEGRAGRATEVANAECVNDMEKASSR